MSGTELAGFRKKKYMIAYSFMKIVREFITLSRLCFLYFSIKNYTKKKKEEKRKSQQHSKNIYIYIYIYISFLLKVNSKNIYMLMLQSEREIKRDHIVFLSKSHMSTNKDIQISHAYLCAILIIIFLYVMT